MFEVMEKRVLNPVVKLMEIYAPHIARRAEPGQFVMLRVDEEGERIPLTVADFDREKGGITVVFQEVGRTTRLLGALNKGERILDFAGPLGMPSHLGGVKRAAVVGGGLGTAIAFPQAKKLHRLGAEVDSILGFRNRELIILEEEMGKYSTRLFVATDDGSNGCKGFVTDILEERIKEGSRYDLVIAIGPLRMMKAVCEKTKAYGIKTIVSMNPIMIDGTGMCGGCRVNVGGKIQFACIDGPDFDGHQVDFEEAIQRQAMYKEEEAADAEPHECRMGGGPYAQHVIK